MCGGTAIRNWKESEALTWYFNGICFRLLGMRHYARGAIVFGKIPHYEDSVVGCAFVLVCRLTSPVARYPRSVTPRAT
jgi:hypothetical protein